LVLYYKKNTKKQCFCPFLQQFNLNLCRNNFLKSSPGNGRPEEGGRRACRDPAEVGGRNEPQDKGAEQPQPGEHCQPIKTKETRSPLSLCIKNLVLKNDINNLGFVLAVLCK
jgi:hypothetical protein